MSTAPEAPGGGAQVPARTEDPINKNCWSCRLLSGGGLILSGAYVYSAARRLIVKRGHLPFGAMVQIVFAFSVAAWGVFIIADPVEKAQRKT